MVRSSLVLIAVSAVFGLTACAVDGRPMGRAGDGGSSFGDGSTSNPGRDAGDCVPSPENTPETCSDGLDNNCNFQWDCSDPSCSGVGDCPICGRIDTPLGSPLALPDGVGNITCTSDASCPTGQRCYTIQGLLGTRMECRQPYRATLNFIGFGGATFDSVNDLTSICVVMEHSWLRDLEITLEAPNGAQVRLQRFLGQEGGEIYLGQANDCDESATPSPGTGARYCWTPTATRPAMLDYANGGGAMDSAPSCLIGTVDMMPPGDYNAAEPWTNLLGTPLNGNWSLLVTDLWPIDNGYIFEWSISFDPNTVDDCSSPLI